MRQIVQLLWNLLNWNKLTGMNAVKTLLSSEQNKSEYINAAFSSSHNHTLKRRNTEKNENQSNDIGVSEFYTKYLYMHEMNAQLIA